MQSILRNERYIGDVLLQKSFIEDPLTGKSKKNEGERPRYYIENNHVPIIDRETFKKAQDEISRRQRDQSTSLMDDQSEHVNHYGKYALNQILVCGECGNRYRRITWHRPQGKVPVWRCISRLGNGKKRCKNSPTLHELPLHEAILVAINHVVYRELVLEAILDSAGSIGMKELNKELMDMYANDPPELKEYDGDVMRRLLRTVIVEKDRLRIVFKDGVETTSDLSFLTVL